MQTQTGDGSTAAPQSNPLDISLASLIAERSSNGRGFALDVAKDVGDEGHREVTYRVARQVDEVDRYEAPPAWRDHRVEDVVSLAAYATRYGTPGRSLVMYTDEQVSLILDEMPNVGRRERVTLGWKHSDEWNTWHVALTKAHGHRELFELLILMQRTLRDATVVEQFRAVRYDMVAKVDSDIALDQETMRIAFTAKKGDELVRLPRQIELAIPVLDVDSVEPDLWVNATVRIEARMPRSHEEKLSFRLICSEWAALRRQRVDAEVQRLRGMLDNWLIVRGSHVEAKRRCGLPAKGEA